MSTGRINLWTSLSAKSGPKGLEHALELVLTGAAISATRAAEIGLINRAVPRAELDATVDALANDLASLSPIVLQLGRQAFYTMEDLPLDQALQYLCGQLTVNTLTEDASEGLMAFVQKRKPEWSGR
jgi:enoyl-CoA hydratase/carnithine racemase